MMSKVKSILNIHQNITALILDLEMQDLTLDSKKKYILWKTSFIMNLSVVDI